jgi:hypothetical protein
LVTAEVALGNGPATILDFGLARQQIHVSEETVAGGHGRRG